MYRYTSKGSRHAQYRPDGTGRDAYIYGDPLFKVGRLFAPPVPAVQAPPRGQKSGNAKEHVQSKPVLGRSTASGYATQAGMTSARTGKKFVPPPNDDAAVPGYTGHVPARSDAIGGSFGKTLHQRHFDQTGLSTTLPLPSLTKPIPIQKTRQTWMELPKQDFSAGYAGHIPRKAEVIGRVRMERKVPDNAVIGNVVEHVELGWMEAPIGYAGHRPHHPATLANIPRASS